MFFIIKTKKNASVEEMEIVNHVDATRPQALSKLETEVVSYIEKNYGKVSLDNFNIHVVDDINAIPIPINLGVYVYQQKGNRDSIYVFLKSQKVNQGYIWNGIQHSFDCVAVFALKQYNYSEVKQTITVSQEPVSIKNRHSGSYDDVLKSLITSNKFISRRKSD